MNLVQECILARNRDRPLSAIYGKISLDEVCRF